MTLPHTSLTSSLKWAREVTALMAMTYRDERSLKHTYNSLSEYSYA